MLTPVERVLILKGADLLKEAGPRQLLRLAEVANEIEIPAGALLYDEADPADSLYMVVAGRVRLSSGGKVMSEVGPGEAFGTWALVDESARGHRAECIEAGLALTLQRGAFYDVVDTDLTLLQQVVRVLAKRLRALVSERPEEARVEGEGVEKPEAVVETENAVATAAGAAAGGAPPNTTAPAFAAGDGAEAATPSGSRAPVTLDGTPATAPTTSGESEANTPDRPDAQEPLTTGLATPSPAGPLEPPKR